MQPVTVTHSDQDFEMALSADVISGMFPSATCELADITVEVIASAPVVLPCCQDVEIPSVLKNTISGAISNEFNLEWNGSGFKGFFVSGSCTMSATLGCDNTGWFYTIRWEGGGTAACIACETSAQPIVTCDPFLVTGVTAVGVGCPSAPSGGSINLNITP